MEKVSLREFIDRREVEIKEIRANLLLELKELRAAKAAICADRPSAATIDASAHRTPSSDLEADKTIKEMVLIALEMHGERGTSDQISNWILSDFGKSYERSSISPQLSRLKRDDKISYDSNLREWILLPSGNSESQRPEAQTRSLDADQHL